MESGRNKGEEACWQCIQEGTFKICCEGGWLDIKDRSDICSHLDNAEGKLIAEAAPDSRAKDREPYTAITPRSFPWQSQDESMLKVPICQSGLLGQWKLRSERPRDKPARWRTWVGPDQMSVRDDIIDTRKPSNAKLPTSCPRNEMQHKLAFGCL